MTNTERIETHNDELRECIEIAEKLPDAESTPSVQTQEKTVKITENGIVTINPDEGYALSKVTANVNVPIPDGYIVPSGTLEITENGEHTVTEYEKVNVSVPTGGGGDDDLVKSIIERTFTEFTNLEITKIGSYAFKGSASLVSVSMPNCTQTGSYCFEGCAKLVTVNLPKVTSIASYTFNGCSALVTEGYDNVTSIGGNSFQNCTSLTKCDFPKATSVGASAFNDCTSLAEFTAPLVTSVGAYAFQNSKITHLSFPALKSMTSNAWRGCPLVSIDLPNVTNIGNNSFRAVSTLKAVTFPKVTSTSSEAMRNCDALTYVDLPVCTSFGTYTFNDCNNLETLILRTTSKVCSMSNVNVLQLTKIANGTGYIYVPASMVDSYKGASNWSTYANQIRAIEDYPEITGG